MNLFERIKVPRGKQVGIYCLTVNNHKYVGSSKTLSKRLGSHKNMLRANKHHNIYLQRAFNKHRKVEYEILEFIDVSITKKELRVIEKLWVDKLEADLNLDDPVEGIGGNLIKKVYQYSLKGEFIREWESSLQIEEELEIPFWRIHSAANPKVGVKATAGFMWRYEKEEKPEYINNLGINLDKREIHLYNLDGKYIKSYSSLSSCARELALELKYDKGWSNLRTTIFYCAQKPSTRTVRKKYKASYTKSGTMVS